MALYDGAFPSFHDQPRTCKCSKYVEKNALFLLFDVLKIISTKVKLNKQCPLGKGTYILRPNQNKRKTEVI